MKSVENYAELAAQAEKAVSAVKDPSLKQIAFQKVLDDLINAFDENPSSGTASKVTKRKSKEVRGSARGGPTQYVQELIGDSFFKKQRTITEVRSELGNRGYHIPLTSLSGPLQGLCKAKALRRQKIKGAGKKQTYAYSNY